MHLNVWMVIAILAALAVREVIPAAVASSTHLTSDAIFVD
jgi:hypothetical protein